MQKSNKILLILILVIAVGVAGFFIGKNSNQEEISNLRQIVETVYPEPPEVINKTSGIVSDVQGATIYLEMNDPEDYIPDPEGDEQDKITKYVSTSNETEIIEISFSESGDQIESSISTSDLEKGDEIVVTSDENIRTNERFNAKRVELLSF